MKLIYCSDVERQALPIVRPLSAVFSFRMHARHGAMRMQRTSLIPLTARLTVRNRA